MTEKRLRALTLKNGHRFELLAGRFRACDPVAHKLSIWECEGFAEECRDAVAQTSEAK